ncbi:hypothetical protein [Streptomyces sp. NPDC004658]|uniref:hypothetical protein n=1 Tax=Streptomyces sp. NPDC004658 TaxID=3154672 RepID=UPI0033BC8D3B
MAQSTSRPVDGVRRYRPRDVVLAELRVAAHELGSCYAAGRTAYSAGSAHRRDRTGTGPDRAALGRPHGVCRAPAGPHAHRHPVSDQRQPCEDARRDNPTNRDLGRRVAIDDRTLTGAPGETADHREQRFHGRTLRAGCALPRPSRRA